MASPMHIDVVAPEGNVWEGTVDSVIVRTTEGDIGILAGHEPVMAALVPCAAELVTEDGRREIIAVGGGFIAVFHDDISLLTESATLASEISMETAQTALAAMAPQVERGDMSEGDWRLYHQLEAQVKAGERFAQLHGSGAGQAG